jgi:hypothetical protein
VERPTADRVFLHAMDQHGHGLFAVKRQIEQGVAAGPPAQQLELMAVELDRIRSDAMAKDHGGHDALPAQVLDGLAVNLASRGGQLGTTH